MKAAIISIRKHDRFAKSWHDGFPFSCGADCHTERAYNDGSEPLPSTSKSWGWSRARSGPPEGNYKWSFNDARFYTLNFASKHERNSVCWRRGA